MHNVPVSLYIHRTRMFYFTLILPVQVSLFQGNELCLILKSQS